jgi:cystathionine gamma-synthase
VEIDHDKTTCAFASGMMAASSIVLAHKMPLTVILPADLYHGVSTVMADVFEARFGVTVKTIDLHTDDNSQQLLSELQNIVSNNNNNNNSGDVIVWQESPSNPKLHVSDIAQICELVNSVRATSSTTNCSNITTVVDSTMAPPVIQQPLHLGADLVMHSGTKYFGGHSDVLLGLVTASPFTARGQALAPILRQVQFTVGGVASPMDSWLTLRGMRTLHVRVERQCQTALVIAKHFYTQTHAHEHEHEHEHDINNSTIVSAVHYPGLESHPRHAVARRQMKYDNYGGVLSVELKSEALAMAFAGALQTIYRATSLGGTETLIEHRASIEPPERRVSPPGLLRITVGLEDPTDLIRDIDTALEIAKQVEQELLL